MCTEGECIPDPVCIDIPAEQLQFQLPEGNLDCSNTPIKPCKWACKGECAWNDVAPGITEVYTFFLRGESTETEGTDIIERYVYTENKCKKRSLQ